LPLAHRWMDSHCAAAARVTCYSDCRWLCLENWRTLHCLRLGRFYPRTVHLRFEMNQVAPSTLVFSRHYHWIRAACSCYQVDNFLSCVIWQSNTNWNRCGANHCRFKYIVAEENVILFVQVLQHEPSTPLSLTTLKLFMSGFHSGE